MINNSSTKFTTLSSDINTIVLWRVRERDEENFINHSSVYATIALCKKAKISYVVPRTLRSYCDERRRLSQLIRVNFISVKIKGNYSVFQAHVESKTKNVMNIKKENRNIYINNNIDDERRNHYSNHIKKRYQHFFFLKQHAINMTSYLFSYHHMHE